MTFRHNQPKTTCMGIKMFKQFAPKLYFDKSK